MKTLFVIFSLAALPAIASAATFKGRCAVLQQPSASHPAKLLANKEISLNSGEVQTIYEDGNIKYQVSLSDVSSPTIHNLKVGITYGAPHFIGNATTSYDDKTLNAGGLISVGVALPGFPTIGCGNN